MEDKKANESKLYKATVYLFRNRPRAMKAKEMAEQLDVSEAFINNLASTNHIPTVVNIEKLFVLLGGKFELIDEYLISAERDSNEKN